METRWFGIGWFQKVVSHSPVGKVMDIDATILSDEVLIVHYTFLPAAWLRIKGFEYVRTKGFGRWQYNFKTIRVVPDRSDIFQACREGNQAKVIRLLGTEEATLLDMSEDGWTLLHVSLWLSSQNFDRFRMWNDLQIIF